MTTFGRQACACGLFLLFCTTAPGAGAEPPVATADPATPKDPAKKPAVEGAAKTPPAAKEPEARYEDEITVEESAEPSLTRASPEAAARELAAVPGGASFVDAEDYKRGRTATLQDALGFAPGVFVQPRFGAEEARLSIRGSGLQRTFHGRGLKLLQDGVPLNLADGAFDFQAVEPLAARYVEVLRGANGLEYGAATLGGAINYLSVDGHEASPAEARVESGAFGYLRAQASSGGARGGFDYYATLSHLAQDGFRRHAAQENQRLFSNFGWRLSEDRETRFYATAVHTDSELPGNLTKAELRADPTRAAAGNVALDQQRNFDLVRLANRTSLRLGAGRQLDLAAFWSYKSLDHPIFQVLDQQSHDLGVDLRYQSDADLFGRENRLVVGASPTYGRLVDERFRNVGGRRGERTAEGVTRSLNLDLYAEDRLHLKPRLALTAGLQASRAGREFEDSFLTDGDQTDSRDFRGVSPKVGLLWEVSAATALFATVGRSFEPPSFGELVNVGGNGLLALDAQTATTAEVGSRGAAGVASWDVVLYRSWIEGELLSRNDAAGNPLGTVNAGRTLHSGLEAGLDLRFGAPAGAGRIVLRQVYDWSRFRFDGDPVYGDGQLAGLPEHFYRGELLWEHPAGFYGGPNLERAFSRYPVDHANTLFADPYTLIGLKAGYRSGQGWAGFVEGRNLTDETYAATTGVIADARGLDSAQFLPGDGRSVYAGLEYRW